MCPTYQRQCIFFSLQAFKVKTPLFKGFVPPTHFQQQVGWWNWLVQELWFCLDLTFAEYGHHCLYGWWCKQQGRGSPGNDDRCWQWHGKSRLQWPTQRLMDSYFLASQFTIPIFLCLCSRDFFNADVHSSRSVWSALQRSLFTGQIWYKGSHKINCWTKLADTEEREWSLCDRADCFLMMATGLFHGCSDTNSIALTIT